MRKPQAFVAIKEFRVKDPRSKKLTYIKVPKGFIMKKVTKDGYFAINNDGVGIGGEYKFLIKDRRLQVI